MARLRPSPAFPRPSSAGEFVSLVGPSGCGKSTLLRIVAGLRPAAFGTITVAGRIVKQPIPDIGMVFQAPILLKWRSILENVLLPAELAGKDAGAPAPPAPSSSSKWPASAASAPSCRANFPVACSNAPRCAVPCCSTRLCVLMDEPFGAPRRHDP